MQSLLLPQRKGYARIRQDYEDFYTRRMYYRIHVRSTNPLHHLLVILPEHVL